MRYCKSFMCTEYPYKDNKYCHECNLRRFAFGVLAVLVVGLSVCLYIILNTI